MSAQAAKLDGYLKGLSGRQLTRPQAIRAAADVHHFIVRNHLFGDGNGRTARMVADWVLMKNGLPPADHAGVPAKDYRYDRRLSPEQTRDATRQYYEKAVTHSETRATRSGRGSRTRGQPERVVMREVPAAKGGAKGAPGAKGIPGEVSLLGLRQGAVYTKFGVQAGTVVGLHITGQIFQQLLHGQRVDLSGAIASMFTPDFVLNLGGFIIGERVAASILAGLIPIPGLGRLIGGPLAQMGIRTAVGAATGQVLGDYHNGFQNLNAVDVVGSSVASGVGMALGTALLPGVGTVIGGVVGGMAWDLGRFLSGSAPSAASNPAGGNGPPDDLPSLDSK